eukprot:CAMPEP_0177604472 /NCGR_PEP_ID=MMETSP0419_2-20121207/16137_1 /TAXON_ID=582737 /ORGANISM="Tetraselmis sp., Strain GSL018" /LENGTH=196 /DNA_ID=CAMNT_0019098459 /DNA_START=185 /DNA_END=775 /DNA_ORIENTATION=-
MRESSHPAGTASGGRGEPEGAAVSGGGPSLLDPLELCDDRMHMWAHRRVRLKAHEHDAVELLREGPLRRLGPRDLPVHDRQGEAAPRLAERALKRGFAVHHEEEHTAERPHVDAAVDHTLRGHVEEFRRPVRRGAVGLCILLKSQRICTAGDLLHGKARAAKVRQGYLVNGLFISVFAGGTDKDILRLYVSMRKSR